MQLINIIRSLLLIILFKRNCIDSYGMHHLGAGENGQNGDRLTC